MKMSLEVIPHNRVDVCVGVVVRLSPVCCYFKELVCGKKNLLVIHALSDHELLLNSLERILGFHGILSLRECGGASSQELIHTRLVRWWRCLLLMSLFVGLHGVEGLHYTLHQLVLSGNQLLDVDRVVVGGGVVGLAIALSVPCGHHLTG
jgi:hypothetical protein